MKNKCSCDSYTERLGARARLLRASLQRCRGVGVLAEHLQMPSWAGQFCSNHSRNSAGFQSKADYKDMSCVRDTKQVKGTAMLTSLPVPFGKLTVVRNCWSLYLIIHAMHLLQVRQYPRWMFDVNSKKDLRIDSSERESHPLLTSYPFVRSQLIKNIMCITYVSFANSCTAKSSWAQFFIDIQTMRT